MMCVRKLKYVRQVYNKSTKRKSIKCLLWKDFSSINFLFPFLTILLIFTILSNLITVTNCCKLVAVFFF